MSCCLSITFNRLQYRLFFYLKQVPFNNSLKFYIKGLTTGDPATYLVLITFMTFLYASFASIYLAKVSSLTALQA